MSAYTNVDKLNATTTSYSLFTDATNDTCAYLEPEGTIYFATYLLALGIVLLLIPCIGIVLIIYAIYFAPRYQIVLNKKEKQLRIMCVGALLQSYVIRSVDFTDIMGVGVRNTYLYIILHNGEKCCLAKNTEHNALSDAQLQQMAQVMEAFLQAQQGASKQ